MSQEDKRFRYTIPLEHSLGILLNSMIRKVPNSEGVDRFMQEIISQIKKHERNVPKSRYRKNIKSYWCPELDTLKRVKINAFREWVSAGKPRDPNDHLFIMNKEAKKNFRKRLKGIARAYDEEKISEAVRSAEVDHTVFWRMLKRERDGPRVKTPSIKDPNGKVVHDLDQILKVWKDHFAALGTPIDSPSYDQRHYDRVSEKLDELKRSTDVDDFSRESFSIEEVGKGISLLNAGKAPGIDGVTKEHLINAGENLVLVITLLFNWILETEYIPINFRRGVQIPLYKGKNTSTMEVNNYCGITLLSIFNKLFELVMWKRMEKWWFESEAISGLQGACRKGVSCVHSAYTLQESISTLLETNSKVFVTYLDVSKAFDGVWIGGLFYRLWELGIRGKTWRLFFNSYTDFQCKARVQSKMSEWYPLRCGIHQGGYLSLIKYLAFINSLITCLEDSGLCSAIHGINVSPLGYADDVASASTSKIKTDQVLNIVYNHSCTWRYRFNPKKSAVLVFGESERENKCNSKYRMYKLGPDRIKEARSYDHLGLKNNCLWQNKERTIEKIAKGRKALNAAAGLGLKPGGLSIKACGMIFWSLVIPIITFACELWVLTDDDIKLLEDFQTYAGRRIQRFSQNSPRATSYVGLGWIRLEVFIYIKKLLFVRTITMLDNTSLYKRIFMARYEVFDQNREYGVENRLQSVTFDILRIADLFGLYEDIGHMLYGTKMYSKKQWRDIVWKKARDIDNQDWYYRTIFFKSTEHLGAIMDTIKPLVWWQLGDHMPELMTPCETMSKLVCRASRLKCDSYLYKNDPVNRPYCEMCNNFAIENVEHLIMTCPAHEEKRNKMIREINDLERHYSIQILRPNCNNLNTLMGRFPEHVDFDVMLYFYRIVAIGVHQMYQSVIKNREGIG